MRKFLTYLKIELKVSAQQWPLTIGVYAILPFLLMLFMGVIGTSSIAEDLEFDPISIAVVNHDDSELSIVLEDILTSEDVSDYFEIEDAEEALYRIEIEDGYGENLVENRVNIYSAPNASTSDLNFLELFLQDFQQVIYEQVELQNILVSEIDENDRNAIAQVITESEQFNQALNVEGVVFETTQALNPLQASATAGLLYICILLASQEASMRSQEKVRGLYKRTLIAPLTPLQNVVFSLSSQVVLGTIVSTIYMVLWKIVYPELFPGNFLIYILIAAIMMFAVLSIFKLLNSIFSGEVVTMFYSFAIVIYIALGMMPADAGTGNVLMDLMNDNPIRRIFQDPINEYSLNRIIVQDDMIILAGLVIFGLVLTFIAAAVTKRKEVRR